MIDDRFPVISTWYRYGQIYSTRVHLHIYLLNICHKPRRDVIFSSWLAVRYVRNVTTYVIQEKWYHSYWLSSFALPLVPAHYRQGSITSPRDIDHVILSARKSGKVKMQTFTSNLPNRCETARFNWMRSAWNSRIRNEKWRGDRCPNNVAARRGVARKWNCMYFGVSRPYFTIYQMRVRIFHDDQHRVFVIITIVIVVVVIATAAAAAAVAVIIVTIQHSANNGPSAQRKRLLLYCNTDSFIYAFDATFTAQTHASIISPRISWSRRVFFERSSNFHMWPLKAIYANFLLMFAGIYSKVSIKMTEAFN